MHAVGRGQAARIWFAAALCLGLLAAAMASDTASAAGHPVLELAVSSDSLPIIKGGDYTLTYAGGTSASHGTVWQADAVFTMVHTPPAGVTFTGAFTGTGWACVFTNANTTMTCTLNHGQNTPPGTDLPLITADVEVALSTATGADLANVSTLDGPSTESTDGVGPILVVPTADLSVVVAGPAAAAVGDALSYTATVSNAGPDPANSAILSVTLTAPATAVATSSGGCNAAGLVVTCALSPIPSGASHATVTVTASSTEEGTIDITGEAEDEDLADPDGATDTMDTDVSDEEEEEEEEEIEDDLPPHPEGETDPKRETDPVERVSGPNRSATAAEMAMRFFDPGVRAVYIARDDTFPDALAGTPIAFRDDAPILLTNTDTLTPVTADVLRILKPDSIVVLGGTAAVSDSVKAALGEFAPVSRISGPDRYATAAGISRSRFPQGADLVLVASGEVFPDALCGGAAAAKANASVLLTSRNQLPQVSADELVRLSASRIVVLGGTSAVAPSVLDAIKTLTGVTPERVSGVTRYETAAAIANEFFPGDAEATFVAAGVSFADALTAGPVAARTASAVLIVPRGALPLPVEAEIRRLRPLRVVVVGGKSAVTEQTEAAIEAARA